MIEVCLEGPVGVRFNFGNGPWELLDQGLYRVTLWVSGHRLERATLATHFGEEFLEWHFILLCPCHSQTRVLYTQVCQHEQGLSRPQQMSHNIVDSEVQTASMVSKGSARHSP
jgi:hypothetical protein